MPRSRLRVPLVLTATAILTIAACSHPRDEARRTLSNIESELAATEQVAEQYVPAELRAAKDSLAELHAAFDEKSYESVFSMSPAVLAKVKSLAETAAINRQIALSTEWHDMSVALPKAFDAVQRKLAALKRRGKVPDGVTRVALVNAPFLLKEAQALWDEASGTQASGKLDEALVRAREAKARTIDLMSSLGMSKSAYP